MKLKKKQKKAIDCYVRACANEIGLRDWTLTVDITDQEDLRATDDHDGDDQVWGAACDPVKGRKYATIKFGTPNIERLLEGDLEDFRQTVAHELTHCHFAPLWDQMRLDLHKAGLLSQPVYDIFIASAERNLEYGIDAMADAIAPRLPLLDWEITKL
jgi:hypothetical protein